MTLVALIKLFDLDGREPSQTDLLLCRLLGFTVRRVMMLWKLCS